MHDVGEVARLEGALVQTAAQIGNHEQTLVELREHRLDLADRLRALDVPMRRIAGLGGVSDSYLARRLFARGVARKQTRRKH